MTANDYASLVTSASHALLCLYIAWRFYRSQDGKARMGLIAVFTLWGLSGVLNISVTLLRLYHPELLVALRGIMLPFACINVAALGWLAWHMGLKNIFNK